jgi:hypothetical protein
MGLRAQFPPGCQVLTHTVPDFQSLGIGWAVIIVGGHGYLLFQFDLNGVKFTWDRQLKQWLRHGWQDKIGVIKKGIERLCCR